MKTILIVDDATVDRMKLGIAVKKLECATIEVKSGQEALETVQHHTVDLILLDLLMPEMDGFETLARLKATPSGSQIPVVIVSSLEDAQELERASDLGAKAFLPKSFTTAELKAALAHAL